MTRGIQAGKKLLGNQEIPVWPENQVVSKWAETDVLLTRYDDHESYAPALRETILKRAGDPSLSHHVDDDNGQHCIKAFDLEKWDSPEAALINARALTMFRRAIKEAKVIVDACWASVYRKGNFVLPHSHAGSIASVLYILEPGFRVAG